MKGDESKIETLGWILEFLSTDLDSLPQRETKKLAIDAAHYLGEPVLQVVENWGDPSFPRRFRWMVKVSAIAGSDELRVAHGALRDFLEDFLHSARMPLKSDNVQWEAKEDSQGTMTPLPILKQSEQIAELDSNLFIELVKAAIIKMLFELPRQSIKACEECGKYFLHLSKKPKYFCTPSCSSKGSSRKRREADPEKYRREQRERMRLKYREAKAKKLGVDPKEVKLNLRVED